MKQRTHTIRAVAILLAGLLLLPLAGCGRGAVGEAAKRDYAVYYLNSSEDQIQTEKFTPMDTSTDALIAELVALQQQAPADSDGIPLLPAGTAIEDYSFAEGTLTLNLSKSYTEIEPAREILARAGLVRTFIQINGVLRVAFQAGGRPIKDQSGNEIGALTAGSFLENAGKEINAYQLTTLKLYFASEDGERMVAETHPVYYTSNEPLERVVVEELMRGPREQGHLAVLASTASVLSVTAQDQICYVNFEASPVSPLVTASEEVQVWAIVNSLIENCSVSKVQFSIAGKSDGVFLDHVPLGRSFEKNNQLIQGG